MLDYAALEKRGIAAGFSHVGPLRADTIQLLPDVRKMCEACKKYDTNWACPPGCGTLEECRERIGAYREGILVQTVGQLEDEMDGEGMMEAEKRHRETFVAFHQALLADYPGLLAIGAGTCSRCKECTYPTAPCRFPYQRTSSMEANGMLVLQVCKDNGMQYYYGPCTIAYTSCFLLV